MLVSHNEVLLTSRKALESLGWAQGDWEDGADAIALFDLYGLEGVARFVAIAPSLRDPYETALTKAGNVFDGQGQSCLRIGPSVVDSCYTDSAESGWATVFLLNCSDPLFLLSYLQRCAQRDRLVIATWQDGSEAATAWQLRVSPHSDQPELAKYALATDAERLSGIHLVVSQDAEFAMPTPDGELVEMISAEFPRRAQQHLANGIVIADAAWQALSKLSKGILVPETDASRLRGAGESGG